MIEKYFKLGVRFRWTKPQNVDGPRDGKIVDSIRPTAQLTYIGLGEVVDPVLMTFHVSTMGLQMNMPIQHQWLDYAPGRTARVPIGPYDVLTGFMSGCIIARWIERGITYIGHIGTVESDPATNRVVKRTFAFAMPRTTTGCNPAAAWNFNELSLLAQKFRPPKIPEICALATTQGEFYSVVMFRDGPNEWYCGGAKRVPPISHDALKMFMLRVD
ncbi:hypothetical protein D6833_06215 [Candidatus Parcubacteria bacterium]|nr:MAG: hypothetical protein D6833_06215 [Candidatus Parcubacteria bacterium]